MAAIAQRASDGIAPPRRRRVGPLGVSIWRWVVLLVTAVYFLLPLWAALDGRAWPDQDWRAAGYQRRRWLTLILLGIPVVLGLVTAVIYFARVRSRLAATATSEIPPRAPVGAAGPAGTPRI